MRSSATRIVLALLLAAAPVAGERGLDLLRRRGAGGEESGSPTSSRRFAIASGSKAI